MKGDPEDLKKMADDLGQAIEKHPDAMRSNPDLAGESLRLHRKWLDRYNSISEKSPEPTPKPEGFVP